MIIHKNGLRTHAEYRMLFNTISALYQNRKTDNNTDQVLHHFRPSCGIEGIFHIECYSIASLSSETYISARLTISVAVLVSPQEDQFPFPLSEVVCYRLSVRIMPVLFIIHVDMWGEGLSNSLCGLGMSIRFYFNFSFQFSCRNLKQIISGERSHLIFDIVIF